MPPVGKYRVAIAGDAPPAELQAALAGSRWVKVELSGTSDAADDRPASIYVGVDAETGTRWTALFALNAEGLTSGQLRDLAVYAREALEFQRLSEKAVEPESLEEWKVMEYVPPARVVVDARFCAWVARYYDVARREAPTRPTSWMAERLGRSTATVDRWIEAARERGLIGQEIGRRKKKRRGGNA